MLNRVEDKERSTKQLSTEAGGAVANDTDVRIEPAAGSGVAARGSMPPVKKQIDKPSMLPALTLPRGGGAVRGIGEKLSVAAATGTASLNVPLPASPGRSSFAPQVSLTYDSHDGNGPWGLGFALLVPTITRKTDKGLPRYYDGEESDEFILSGSEDLVPNRVPGPGGDLVLDASVLADRTVQRYRPRVEGLFARIERHTLKADGSIHWRVTTKDNVTHVYGQSAAAQIVDPTDPVRVFSWLLEESRDDRGEVIQYVYKAEDGAGVDPTRTSERSRFDRTSGAPVFVATAQRYLKRVRYGNSTPGQAADFLFEMVFDYGEHQGATPSPDEDTAWPVRVDPFSSYRSGFEVRTYRLGQRILMFHRLSAARDPLLVRSTNFGYSPGPAFTYLTSITQHGFLFDDGGALLEDGVMPTLELDYARPVLHDELAVLPPQSTAGLSGGVDGARKQWVDLDGEGIPGILIDDDYAWFYKANAGGACLHAPRALPSLPTPSALRDGKQQLVDLGGDGQMDLVAYGPPVSGFATRTTNDDFDPFRTFPALPNLDWRDPNLRFIDIDGDGLPDILVSEDEAFMWYRSLAKDGFEPGKRTFHPSDDNQGAAIVFAEASESIQLADMSGDGLVDIVRIRNGEVCYWPNLGYGRFGAKVTLDASPLFAGQDEFDARRIRFADVDGSGSSDILYLGTRGVTLYFNQSGNALAPGTPITSLPAMDSAGRVTVVDLLGTGTATLVWSSPLPEAEGRQVLYVDLMNGVKPHLLISVVNNLGASTQITYAPSTKFYLADKAAGIPWLTRLPFPVQVVAQVDYLDAISKSHLTSSYSYRHGFYDGIEREFRGFARVEQTDAQVFTVGAAGSEEFQPPTRTVTWFHTGAWLEKERLEAALAKEFFQGGPTAILLPDTIFGVPAPIPPAPSLPMTIADEREATRALRGHMLHQEVYANDGQANPEQAGLPFVVTEQSFEVRLVQTSRGWRHGVFFAFPRETVTLHSERNPDDPRATHEMILDVDSFGNVTRQAAIAYARAAGAAVEPEQARAWVTESELSFINHDDADFYRIGMPVETRTYELTNLAGMPSGGQGLFTREALEAALANLDAAHDVAYDVTPPPTGSARRMLDRRQQLYYANDASGVVGGAAPLGQTGSLGLPFESYQLALTPGLVDELTAQSLDLTSNVGEPGGIISILTGTGPGEGFYVQRPGDGGYWTRSGRIQFDKAQFYLPVSLVDRFGQTSFVSYDAFHLLVTTSQDALGNLTQAVNDYRVLAPSQLTDPNLNRVQVAFNGLGLVVASTVMGKTTEDLGDTLDKPTTEMAYDLTRWQTEKKPVLVHTKAREQHGGGSTRFQESFIYSDGFGRVVMKKVQAEPGPVPGVAGTVDPRWIGTGRTIFNNKDNPVKQYEPFFSATPEFEDEATVVQAGVTPILHYDALDRVVRIELPNGTESNVKLDAWQQIRSDPNDTVLDSPWFSSRGAPDPAGPEPSDPEQRAAWLAARTAETPTLTQLDALGRAFLVIEQNRTWANGGPPVDELLELRTVFDVEGNPLAIIDPRQAAANPGAALAALTQRFDVLSRSQRSDSRDAGVRLSLADVAGKPIRAWDSRGQIFRYRYDDLQRPSHLFVQKTIAESTGQPGQTPDDLSERLVLRTIYGEALDPAGPTPTDARNTSPAQAVNLRGQQYLLYDSAGCLTNDKFDFKGNPLSTTRRMARDYHGEPKWNAPGNDLTHLTIPAAIQAAAESLLDPPTLPPATSFTVFTILAEYDALNRITKRTTPDLSVTIPTYDDGGLLKSLAVGVRGAAARTVIASIDYNARGQRLLCRYVDPTTNADATTAQVTYGYDPFTFRLTSLITWRPGNGADVGAAKLQDLLYTYDPVGNVVELDDRADTAPVFGGSTPVTGNGRYRYDALYRLIQAEGREHPGQQNISTQPRGDFDIPVVPHPNDLQALIRYNEKYGYDEVGNIQKLTHTTTAASGGPGPSWTQWTRNYSYAPDSNRLLATSAPGDAAGSFSDSYAYTGNGAMNHMSSLPVIEWDFADRMRHANKDSGGGDVFFTYDGSGERVRKVWQHSGQVDERIYLRGWESFRSRPGSIAASATLERETLHVMDDGRRVAMVETKTVDVAGGSSGPLWRLQFSNLLDSAVMELDAQGRVISYEEYHPYGSTSFQSFASGANLSAKRYRYTGKERDEETGLYYHGARYYVPWLGRWSAADPVGNVDGPNLYVYARGNPLALSDPSGTQADEPPGPQGVGLTLRGSELTLGPLGQAPPGNTCDELNPLCARFRLELTPAPVAPPAPPEAPVGPPTSAPAAPEAPVAAPPQRGFLSRGGGSLIGGGVSLGVGILILASGPVGWLAGLAAALAIAGGVAITGASTIQLTMSYGGKTTAKQDVEFSKAASTTLALSSPGGLAGGTVGVAVGGEEGLEKGAFYGGLAEGAAVLTLSGGRIALREFEFGRRPNPAWKAVQPDIRDLYGFGDPALRARPNVAFPRGVERVDLSHWIPQRLYKGSTLGEYIFNRPWNVTPMWAGEHALIDASRLRLIRLPWKNAYEAAQFTGLSRQLRLVPPSLLQVGYGGVRLGESQFQLHLGGN